jgi:hypothetical protein
MTYVAMDEREMIRVHTLVNKIIHNKTKRLSNMKPHHKKTQKLNSGAYEG